MRLQSAAILRGFHRWHGVQFHFRWDTTIHEHFWVGNNGALCGMADLEESGQTHALEVVLSVSAYRRFLELYLCEHFEASFDGLGSIRSSFPICLDFSHFGLLWSTSRV